MWPNLAVAGHCLLTHFAIACSLFAECFRIWHWTLGFSGTVWKLLLQWIAVLAFRNFLNYSTYWCLNDTWAFKCNLVPPCSNSWKPVTFISTTTSLGASWNRLALKCHYYVFDRALLVLSTWSSSLKLIFCLSISVYLVLMLRFTTGPKSGFYVLQLFFSNFFVLKTWNFLI